MSLCFGAFVVTLPLYWKDVKKLVWGPLTFPKATLQNSLSLYLHFRTEFGREGSPEFEAFLPTQFKICHRDLLFRKNL